MASAVVAGTVLALVTPTWGFTRSSDPLSAYITGPTVITAEGEYQWTVVGVGGTGVYTGRNWQRNDNGTGWYYVFGKEHHYGYVSASHNGNFLLKARVLSGSDSTYAYTSVTVSIP
jgi:hypothetical protein